MEASRELFWEISFGWTIYVLAAISIGVVGYSLYRRIRLWQVGQKDQSRLEQMGTRTKLFLRAALVDGIFHKRFFRDPYPGLIHFLFFGGAGLLLLTTAADALSHYTVEFMVGNTYLAFSFMSDLGGVALLLGVVLAAIRRYIQKPSRLDTVLEDGASLALVFVVVLTGYAVEALRITLTSAPSEWEQWAFLGYGLSSVLAGGSVALYQVLWWVHSLLVIGSILYVGLSFSKLAHIVVSPTNMFFRSLQPKGALTPINLETAEVYGNPKIEDFTWKQLMDLDACTRCGRCQDNCPAHLTGKALSPKKVIQDLKGHYHEVFPKPLAAPPESRTNMVTDVVTEEVLWDCTTCRACQEACPVLIEHVDKVVGMRRNLVLEHGSMPETVEGTLRCMETRGHSCRGTTLTRTGWTSGLGIKTVAELEGPPEILYWPGCEAALEERNTKVAIAFARLMQAAQVNFAILGEEETCCGDPARRLGNEYLYQTLAQQNIETLKNHNITKIVTTCPHCFNTLKNEYPQFGGQYEVVHHSQYLQELLRSGRLKLAGKLDKTVTYHDGCYLGRYNDVYQPPRQVLGQIPGVRRVEMARHGSKAFCCGGGGGHFWVEEKAGTARISETRTGEALDTKADFVATACPFCLQMFEDAIKAKDAGEVLKARDISELLAAALQPEAAPAAAAAPVAPAAPAQPPAEPK